MALDGLTYRMLKTEDHEEVMQFVVKHFVREEPVASALLISPEEGRILFETNVKAALWQNVSIGVFDDKTKEMCAVRINLLGKNEDLLPPLGFKMEEQSLKVRQFNKVVLFLIGERISETFGIKNYFDLYLVSVRHDYGKRGIAKELYKRSHALAKEHECSLMVVICSSAYTLRATTGLKYEVMKQIPYTDYVDPITGKKVLKNMRKPHVLLAVVTKRI